MRKFFKIELGEIGRQTIKGSGYSYFGVLLGFVTTAILFPRLLTLGQIGVTTLIMTYAQFLSIMGNLGFGAAITRLFPYFKNYENGHNGIVFLATLVLFGGFAVSAVIYHFLYPYIVSQDVSNELFFRYSWIVFPLGFFILAFNLFDTYARALGNAVTGAFIKEILQRFLLLGSVVFFGYTSLIEFDEFILLYAGAFSASGVFLVIYLIIKNQFVLTPRLNYLRKGIRRVMFNVSLYAILQGFGNILVQRIDTVMISFYLTLEETGVYGTTFFFGLLILMPSRALSRISSNVLAQALKDKNYERVRSIYRKSSVNQYWIGVLVFIGLWGNIDNVFIILTDKFRIGKYVIFFIGLSNLVNTIIGANVQIIQLSKYYRYLAYLLIVFVVLIVATNFAFIPFFGITGAAIASFISVLIYSLIRLIIVYRKFGMHPFEWAHVRISIVALVSYSVALIVPEISMFIVDIFVRSAVILVVYLALSILFNTSEDLNKIISQLKSKLN